MDRKFRIGIVGCGGMGGGHAVALQSGTGNAVWHVKDLHVDGFDSPMTTDISKMMELAGIVDIKPDRRDWARSMGMYVYESYEALLADESVDAILIATPNHLHKPMAIAAMQAGKHVLCEKPVMLSSDELLEVMAVAKDTGKVFYPRQNREWDEDYLIIKKIYEEKILGNTFEIQCRIMGSRGIPGDWRGIKEQGGGMMLDWGVHVIDRIVKLMDCPLKKVFCSMKYITNPECDDNDTIHLTFANGVTVLLEVDTCHFVNLPLWTLYADHGSAVINDWACNGKMMKLYSWEDKDTTPILAGAGLTKTMAPRKENTVEELPLPRFDFDRNELYRNFVETCQGKAEQIVTEEHALRILRVMEACFKSAAEGIVVDFE